MKIKLMNVAVAGVLALAGGAAVAADDAYNGSWYVVPGISLLNADSDLQSNRAAPAGSLRLGKELSEHWDVQLGGSYGRAESKDSYNGNPLGGHYKQTLLGVDVMYMFSRDKLRPFLLAGAGYARNNVDYTYLGAPAGGSKNSWMGNVGAGLQYHITDNIGLQADLRRVWSRANGVAAGAGFNDTSTIGNNYLDFGVIFNFGGPKKVAAAEAPAPVAPPAMAEVAPAAEEPVPAMLDAAPAEPVQGPDKPAFAKISLQAEVLFDFDKDVLKAGGKKILDVEVVEKMKAHPEVELVLITGHTDRIGDVKYNQHLSERRANAVRNYVASQGIANDRLHAVGKGEADPVADCKGIRGKSLVSCLQPNRRVVVEIEVQRTVDK
ncbi:outer membrane porin F precursor [mine drainage metagenome]|uniref:Outer membrane porin F n=1 Tax=mine drainage metagenome TaxID=410659 RepID=A0A1J5QEC1_9ZZZZ